MLLRFIKFVSNITLFNIAIFLQYCFMIFYCKKKFYIYIIIIFAELYLIFVIFEFLALSFIVYTFSIAIFCRLNFFYLCLMNFITYVIIHICLIKND